MAKLSDRQKRNIIAKWHTGQYTKTAIAKSYKVTEKVVRDLVGKEKPRNADIVEASVIVEVAKKSDKTTSETTAINNAVSDIMQDDEKRNKIDTLSMEVLDAVSKLIKKGKGQKVVMEGMGDGVSRATIVESDLQANDLKQAQDTIDKASITLKVNERHAPKSDTNVVNQVNVIKPTF